ncbi:MAG: sulfurtransferase TusA family protein [Candidatus Lokiarchaeota archaeon]|nr:sulfurtransferase TusA family protein [Candidatus Lokiarchaeota archaeon]
MNFDENLDVKGKTCPIPVLLTKKKIKTLESGKILKIIGDFEPAKDNIQNFLKKEGYEILLIEEDGQFYSIYTKLK